MVLPPQSHNCLVCTTPDIDQSVYTAAYVQCVHYVHVLHGRAGLPFVVNNCNGRLREVGEQLSLPQLGTQGQSIFWQTLRQDSVSLTRLQIFGLRLFVGSRLACERCRVSSAASAVCRGNGDLLG